MKFQVSIAQIRSGSQFVFALMVFLMFSLGGCATNPSDKPPVPQLVWVRFESDQGDFSILMPGRPNETVSEQPRTNAEAIRVHKFIVDPNESVEFALIYNDYPDDLPFIDLIGSPWFFDKVQEEFPQILDGGRLLSSKGGSFESNPIRDIHIQFEMADKALLSDVRIIVVGHRMYQLIVVWQPGTNVSKEEEMFFASFQLRDRRNKAAVK